MSTEILTCLIVQLVVLLGYILTFITQKRKDRNEMKKFTLEQKTHQDNKLSDMKKELVQTLSENRDEYLKQIADIKAAYQESTTTFTLQIEELSRRVEKHNNVIERTYALEKEIGILDQRESASEHRLKYLEGRVAKCD